MPTKKMKTVANSHATLSTLMRPQSRNFFGQVFGGEILQLMDQVAYLSAAKHCGTSCITAGFEYVNFHNYVHVGELVTLEASVNYVGTSSMEVGIRVTAEDPQTGKKRHTNSGYVIMVAINKKGRPVKVPELKPETATEKRRHKEAAARYTARKKRLKKA